MTAASESSPPVHREFPFAGFRVEGTLDGALSVDDALLSSSRCYEGTAPCASMPGVRRH